MDLFKYVNTTTFQQGHSINGYDSASWVERYRDPGEFEIVARLSSGLREFLPIGSVISHIGTLSVMVVENHQISDAEDVDPQLTISGRTFHAVLDHRIVGQRWDWAINSPPSLADTEYVLASASTWVQAVKLINDHIKTGDVIYSNDAIPNVLAAHTVSITGTTEERIISPGSVLERLLEILEVDDLGCRVIRPHNFPGLPNPGSSLTIKIHDGTDRRDRVKFSTIIGDIASADYLWSDKKYKTSALIVGKFVSAMYLDANSGLNRRVMLVDGSDIDGRYETIPTGGTLTTIRTRMETRGKQAIRKQRRLALIRSDTSETPTYEFRKDYNIGDIVSLDSTYGPNVPMRVVEHVEIEDENGSSSHPTLEEFEV